MTEELAVPEHEQLAFLESRVRDLGLTTRVMNAIIGASSEDVKVRMLVMMSRAEFLRLPNIGRESMQEVDEILRAHGLRIGMPKPVVPGYQPPRQIEYHFKIEGGPDRTELTRLALQMATQESYDKLMDWKVKVGEVSLTLHFPVDPGAARTLANVLCKDEHILKLQGTDHVRSLTAFLEYDIGNKAGHIVLWSTRPE